MRFLSFLLLPCCVSSQVNPAFLVKANLNYNRVEYKGDGLFGFETNDKFGYMDKTGKIIIPAEYSYKQNAGTIPFFHKGLIAVKKGDKMGIIDKTGNIIIPFEYDNVYVQYQVKDVFPAVKKANGKNFYGIINSQNKVSVPLVYDELLMDSNLIKVKKSGKWGVVNIAGQQILPEEYDAIYTYSGEKMIQATKGDQLKFFTASGTLLFEKAKNVYTILGCADGMIRCKVNDKYGFLDHKGNEVIITRYDDASDFINGLAKVGKKTAGSGTTTLYGFIDKKANEIVPLKYPSANLGLFQFGLIRAKDPETNRWGYYDKTGKWVLQPAYLEAVNSDYLGGLWVKMTDGKYHYINRTGKDFGTIDNKGSGYYFFGESGYSVYADSETPYALIDKTGNTIKLIEDCDGIYSFINEIAGYKCKSNGKYGFLDLNGNKIINCEYDGFGGFYDGVSRIDKKIDGRTKSGLIDSKGTILLPVVYESLGSFRDGWAIIRKDSNHFFVDRNGNLKDAARRYNELYDFHSGYSKGVIKGKNNNPNTYYYINKDLREEFSFTGKEAYDFWDDVAVVKTDKEFQLMNKKGEIIKSLGTVDMLKFSVEGLLAIRDKGKWGFVNNRGEIIIAPKYDSCDVFKYGYAKVKMKGKWGIIDRSGTQVLEPGFDNIFPGENGVFIFYENLAWGVVDRTGKILVSPNLPIVTSFENDRALARKGKTFAIVKSPMLR
ncbi:MAG TPA: WG repeat-containing protein [Chitinophagaceae bacterium]|nr:WG repeat-containing protein [Chitinophagaceae bacterium]